MTLTFNDTHECKLTTRALIDIEKELGVNPLNALFDEDIPEINILVTILHYALKACNKSITKDATYDIVDEYYENGGDFRSLSQFILELYKASGLLRIPDDANTTDDNTGTEKN